MTFPAAISVSSPLPPHRFARRIAERWRGWRRRWRWVREVGKAAASGRLDEMLHDVGATRAELALMIDAPAGTQFETMSEMAQIDLRRLDPVELREAIGVCTRCAGRSACKRWLRTGVWRGKSDMRCPNARLFRR